MSQLLSREQFLAQWSSSSLADLREACKQLGHTLKARTKNDAVEEAWHVYTGKLPKNAEPAGVDSVPQPQLLQSVIAQAELPPGEVELEGRSKCGRDFWRAGVKFSPRWHPVVLSPEQLEKVRQEPMVQVRVKA